MKNLEELESNLNILEVRIYDLSTVLSTLIDLLDARGLINPKSAGLLQVIINEELNNV